jgi:hypothetical protein
MDTAPTLVPEGPESGVSRAATKTRVIEEQAIARQEILSAAKALHDQPHVESAETQALYAFVEATRIYLEAELELETK